MATLKWLQRPGIHFFHQRLINNAIKSLISYGISELAGTVACVFSPIVYPEQVPSFENFAHGYYQSLPDVYSPGAGNQSFGFGISALNLTATNGDYIFHDTTGKSQWPTELTFLTPVLQIGGQGSAQQQSVALMYNYRSYERIIVDSQDAVINCVAHSALSY